MVKYCPDCGSEIGETDKFCKSCGKQLIIENKRKNKITLLLAIAIIVIASIMAVYLFTPEIKTVTIPTDNEITFVETYKGIDIYRWNNYYFGDGVFSPSLVKLKNFLIFWEQYKQSPSKSDIGYEETYHGYRIRYVRLQRKIDSSISQIEYMWLAEDERGSDVAKALEKETLTYIIDNRNSLINAIQ